MSSRPTRRATRRTAVVDSDDEDDLSNTTVTKIHEDEEDFAPEPSRTTRRTTRSARTSVAPEPAPAPGATAPRRRGRPKKTPTPAPEPQSEEATEIFEEADQTADVTAHTEADVTVVKQEEEDPITQVQDVSPLKTTPKKRKSSAPRASITAAVDFTPPTPQTTVSPETNRVPATPMADITSASVNTQIPFDPQATVRASRFNTSIMDKPLDIMLKSRTTTIPFVEETAPKSRTVLKYLILQNFKSYAGRQEVGPFHASFSSVVGPNGSGKSNVIDSLLFVFGFRASKMRQGKISALIHNSAQYPNLDYCEVAVHFQEVMDQVSSNPFETGALYVNSVYLARRRQ